MDFKNGLYRVIFGSPLGEGFGVAYLTDGRLFGGDSMMAYVGTYSLGGGTFLAEVHVFKHSSVPGMESAIGSENAQLTINGEVNGETMVGTGTAPQAPGVTLRVRLELLRD